jgi:hypothetical protein
LGSDELRAQLNRPNKQLWDHEKNRPCAEYQAIEQASEVIAQFEDLNVANLSQYYAIWMYQALRGLLTCCSKVGKRLGNAWKVFEQLQEEAARNHSPMCEEASQLHKSRLFLWVDTRSPNLAKGKELPR